MKRAQFLFLAVVAAAAFLGGCVSMGWGFGPGLPCTSGTMFVEPPVILHRGGEYFLTWTQGEYPFFFEPRYQVRDGRLVFAVSGTASSGNLAGQDREMKIEGADSVQALRNGGAVWWERDPEPNGRWVTLRVFHSAAFCGICGQPAPEPGGTL